jgi:outer membrane protein assembly factor BamB
MQTSGVGLDAENQSRPPASVPGTGSAPRRFRTVGGTAALLLLSLALTSCNWLVYHGSAGGSGADPSGTSFTTAHQAWVSPALGGQLFGEPLVLDSRVFVATEADAVVALSATDGSVLWSTTVATPVPSGDLPCGDISPTVGITSTPVVDASRNEIFVVADELVGTSVQHHLVGLSVTTGAVQVDQVVDPPGSDAKAQLQRVALTLDAGRVVIGYGGNSGDCSDYHGWLVAVPETGGALSTFEVDAAAGESQGAIWMGGAAPVVDAGGNLWVAAGNGSSNTAGDPYDDSDSVLELSSSLVLLQNFSPSTWLNDNLTDADLGSSSPAVLPDGLVFQAGKSGTGYLLQGSALGGIGGQVAQLAGLCNGVVDGGDAFANSVVYAPCSGGVVAVQVGTSPPSLTRLWQTATKSKGPPILAGGLVWTITGSTLYGLDPSTGASSVTFPLSGEANHFPTPAVGDGLLLAPATSRVYAFTPPPVTTVVQPAAGTTLTGVEGLDAIATSTVGVAKVEFRLTGRTLTNSLIGAATPTIYGWAASWDTSGVANGAYTLRSVAYDGTGASTASAGIAVTVKN